MNRGRAYRSLLVLHPRGWRWRHGDVVLGTLLELHEQQGRTRPSLGDRVRFAADGLRVRLLPPPSGVGVTAHAAPLSGFVRFDQENGLQHESVVGEREQLRANSGILRDADEQRVVAVASAGMNALIR